GVAREQRDARDPLAVDLRRRPHRGERERDAAVDAEVKRLARHLPSTRAAALGFEPLEISVGDLQGAARRARYEVAVRRSPRHGLDARVDHLVRDLEVLVPSWHETPAQHPCLGLALWRDDREHLFGWRDVV